jgi:hypothetical protein
LSFVKCLRATNRRAEAVAFALDWRATLRKDPLVLYQLACQLSGCARPVAPGAAAQPSPSPGELRRYADEAIATLRQAIDAGYQDLARIREDPDWDSVRSRPDFQALLRDLAFTNPFTP